MPWNDNSNPGPWGAPPPGGGDRDNGPKRPSGDGPRRPGGPGGPGGPRRPNGPPQPDLNELSRRLNERLQAFFGGPDGVRPGAIAAVVGVAVAAWALTGAYVVQPNEQAIVTTFGAYSRSAGPGLRYHLPAPFEDVEKVQVTSLRRIDVGGVAGAEMPQESLMLTGDENIVDLNFSVQWRVADAAKYLFNLKDPDEAVKAVAESAMREVVGRTELTPILTNGRGQVQIQTAELMQKMLDAYGAGVNVVEVQIRSANPPKDVVPAYQDLARAGQDAQSAINDANTYRNRVVNEAKGDASRIVQSSQGYREQSVLTAKGDASRFAQVYGEYKRAPAVTRERLYLETMEKVLGRSNKVIVDGKGTTAPVILPPDVFRPRGDAAQPAPPPAQPAPPAVQQAPAAAPGA
ncbi:MAG: FtsH protease activity modulator HflK [Caulobacteraceae bacterium]|nr:FtsH protease activity modulator HflK [Caulobacteraceae bacterium]